MLSAKSKQNGILRLNIPFLFFFRIIIKLHNCFVHIGFGNDKRLSRQGAANGDEVDEIGPLDIGTIAQAGERCVEKVKK